MVWGRRLTPGPWHSHQKLPGAPEINAPVEGARAPSSDLRPLEQAGVPARGWARRGCSGECRADLGGQPQRQGEAEARCPARVALGVDDGVLAGAAVELGDQVTRRWPESSGKPSVPSRALHRLPEREPQPHMLMFWPPAETDTGAGRGGAGTGTRGHAQAGVTCTLAAPLAPVTTSPSPGFGILRASRFS